jgi:ATPase family associated with various cellular activities (AAA)
LHARHSPEEFYYTKLIKLNTNNCELQVSPTIIFVDEVDSMLGQRARAGEHEAMRKIKNEFMTHWDGLMTKSGERILVLAATNRPFDLDEAIIRRFERRYVVGIFDFLFIVLTGRCFRKGNDIKPHAPTPRVPDHL